MTNHTMNKMRFRVFAALAAVAGTGAAGCTDDPMAPLDDARQVVVEAYLFAGQPVRDIRLTETVPLGEDPALAPTVDDAVVRLIRGTSVWPMSRLDEPGMYGYPGDDLDVRPGDSFRIEVDAFERTATGETVVPGPPAAVEMDKRVLEVPVFGVGQRPGGGPQGLRLTVTWENPEGRYHFVGVESLDPDAESIFPDFIRDRIGGFRFRSPPTREEFFTIGLQLLEDMGPHQAIVYRVNEEYADLYEGRVQDSRDLNEPPSNISGGLGIFSAFHSVVLGFELVRVGG